MNVVMVIIPDHVRILECGTDLNESKIDETKVQRREYFRFCALFSLLPVVVPSRLLDFHRP